MAKERTISETIITTPKHIVNIGTKIQPDGTVLVIIDVNGENAEEYVCETFLELNKAMTKISKEVFVEVKPVDTIKGDSREELMQLGAQYDAFRNCVACAGSLAVRIHPKFADLPNI